MLNMVSESVSILSLMGLALWWKVELRIRWDSYLTGLLLKRMCSEEMSLEGREGVQRYRTGICERRGSYGRSYLGLQGEEVQEEGCDGRRRSK